ncbi:MAG: pseudouridine synthase [Patescibacteria group bacterium]|jgi:23S rRNA pseudouridine2604 synthase
MEKINYPVIINKYLALKKISSRKEADRLLKSQKIKINDRLAEPGQMVYEKDKVKVDYRKNFVYLAFYKPRGVITHSPQNNEKSIEDVMRFPEKVFPIGRLDKDSFGLIILTNDGRITDKMLNPDFYHEKEYEVETMRIFGADFLKKISSGVELDDGFITRRCQVKKLKDYKFSIILTEGKKHQIRRMCEALGERVSHLKRVRIMNINLGLLHPGEYRQLAGTELKTFLGNLDLV